MGKMFLKTGGIVISILLVPVLITMLFSGKVTNNEKGRVKQATAESDDSDKTYSVEEYLMIAMAGTIDLEMNMETLKSQAVILRTWVYEKQQECKGNGTVLSLDSLGIETMTLDQLKNKVSIEQYQTEVSNIENAIYSTKGQVITYGGAPILAYFHFANTGKTRSYEDAYGEKIPYLQSVESSADIESSVGISTKTLKKSEVLKKLKEKYKLEGVTEDTLLESLIISEKEESGYVHTVKVGSLAIKGEDFKSLFSLNSTNFYFEEKDENLRIICKGKGLGIGFSQYGANVMAEQGKSYEELLAYYYPGVQITRVDNLD